MLGAFKPGEEPSNVETLRFGFALYGLVPPPYLPPAACGPEPENVFCKLKAEPLGDEVQDPEARKQLRGKLGEVLAFGEKQDATEGVAISSSPAGPSVVLRRQRGTDPRTIPTRRTSGMCFIKIWGDFVFSYIRACAGEPTGIGAALDRCQFLSHRNCPSGDGITMEVSTGISEGEAAVRIKWWVVLALSLWAQGAGG